MASKTKEGEKNLEASIEDFRKKFRSITEELGRYMVGQEMVIDYTLMAMISGGHVLLEGVPGLGKTLLVKSMAKCLDLEFKRVQFTPDLMPADLIGTNMLHEDEKGRPCFEFSRGPIFCNLLLADEINRATPKTQSALLEAMQEKSVTVSGASYPLAKPYFVLATQNPIEQEGTYPLPEAQLDRFFFKLNVEYPSFDEFDVIMERTTKKEVPQLSKVFEGSELLEMGRLAREVPVPETIKKRAIELVMGTHPETKYSPEQVKKYARFGASPRAGQAMLLTAKIRAILQGRYHVATEDLFAVSIPVLNHRVILNFEAQADGITPGDLLADLINQKRKAWGE